MAKNEKSEAAEKIEKAAKEKKSGAPKNKNGNIFQRIGKWFVKFWKDFKGEIKKITWPGAKMVLKSTLVVIVSIAVIGVLVFAVDWALSRGVDGLESLASKSSASEVVDDEADADKADDAEGAEKADEAEASDEAEKSDAVAAATTEPTSEAAAG